MEHMHVVKGVHKKYEHYKVTTINLQLHCVLYKEDK